MVHHLLRYLKGIPSQGLLFSSQSALNLTAYVDANWVACNDTRKSTSGYCVFLGDSMVAWKSKKQTTISHSYHTLAFLASEVTWIRSLLLDFAVTPSPALVFCDNQAAIYIATNPSFHERTKHIEIDLHFVHEKVAAGTLCLAHVRTHHQLADLLTNL